MKRLNIKTTRLASLTAVFRPKKKVPPCTAEGPSAPTIDVGMDDAVDPPEQDSHADGPEPIPPDDGNRTETDYDSNSDGDGRSGDESSMVDSDSEDEFESDDEGVNEENGCRASRGTLDFELKAAEAGSVPTASKVSKKN